MASSLTTAATWLGALTAVVFGIKALDALLLYNRPSKLHRYLHTKDGKPAWALVTGSSDGIGKAYAKELAARGFNIVLHGRNAAKLERLQRELGTAHPQRQFRSLVIDATQCVHAPDTFKDIVHRLSDIHLTLLVNNAGGTPVQDGTDIFKPLDVYTNKEIADTINLNATFPSMLINALVPLLAQSAPALILNMGSMADLGMPMVASYGASKAYLRALTESVGREMAMAGRDVQVLHLRVGATTGVVGIWKPPSLFEPHASTFVKAALARVGCGRTVVVPYWGHALQAAMTSMMPRWAMDLMVTGVMADMQKNGLNGNHKPPAKRE